MYTAHTETTHNYSMCVDLWPQYGGCVVGHEGAYGIWKYLFPDGFDILWAECESTGISKTEISISIHIKRCLRCSTYLQRTWPELTAGGDAGSTSTSRDWSSTWTFWSCGAIARQRQNAGLHFGLHWGHALQGGSGQICDGSETWHSVVWGNRLKGWLQFIGDVHFFALWVFLSCVLFLFFLFYCLFLLYLCEACHFALGRSGWSR